MDKRFDVIAFGAMNMDYFYQVPSLAYNDQTTIIRTARLPGGSAPNTAYALAKWQARLGVLGVVGDDEDGIQLKQHLKDVKADISQIKTKQDSASGRVICLTDLLGKQALYISPGANDLLTEADINLEYMLDTRIVHLSSFVGEAQLDLQLFLVRNLPNDIVLSFAPGSIYASRGLRAIEPILRRTNILFLNRNELDQLLKNIKRGKSEYAKGARYLQREYGCRMVCVTLDKGVAVKTETKPREKITSYLIDGDSVDSHDAEQGFKVVDTVGSGDAFCAGVLYGLLVGTSLERRTFLGHKAALGCIGALGARDGIPSYDELSRSYEVEFHESLKKLS